MNNDLISRSALLKNKTRMTEYDESGCGVHVFVVKEEDVLEAPAVDAEVVRHGRWHPIKEEMGWNCPYGELTIGYKCSECGWEGVGKDVSPYCPNCGAKMMENRDV